MNSDLDTPSNEPEPAAKEAEASRPVRDQRLRRELLTRLSPVPYDGWSAAQGFAVAEEVEQLVDLTADSFLEPLRAIAPTHRK